MSTLTAKMMAKATGGRWERAARDDPRGVGIDSRTDLDGRVFIALRGASHDGHDHVRDAVDAGACSVIVEDAAVTRPVAEGVGVLVVDDTRRALTALASAHRVSLRGTVVAITGTVGKTTTKTILDAILSRVHRGTCAPRSFNNDIGVPLTLLEAAPDDAYVLVEVGTNAPGEVAALAQIARPDVAVITAVGHGHLEGLGDLDGVRREKLALLEALGRGGLAVVVDDPPGLADAPPTGVDVIRFGSTPSADLRLCACGEDGGTWWFELEDGSRWPIALPGAHNARNALAAMAVARRFEIGDGDIRAGLTTVKAPPMRMTRRIVGEVEVFNDAYNANPESMRAGLATFEQIASSAPRRIAILGDMLELGDRASVLHRSVGRAVGRSLMARRLDAVIVVGEHASVTSAGIRAATRQGKVVTAASVEQLTDAMLVRLIEPGDAIYLKGSRGMALERIETRLQKLARNAGVAVVAGAAGSVKA